MHFCNSEYTQAPHQLSNEQKDIKFQVILDISSDEISKLFWWMLPSFFSAEKIVHFKTSTCECVVVSLTCNTSKWPIFIIVSQNIV